ncbi:hypothetical protein [Erythrobacter sp. MTPC3]|uniref:hypothetical protein n=1 Tax=Erythrobacter sp. MTPC3 TaxID=3056564 RepID=UPI0036F28003
MKRNATAPLILATAFVQASCAEPAPSRDETAESSSAGSASEQDAFFSALSSHCGNAYSGQLVSDDPVDADFASAEMVMHVRECSPDAISVPFHVKTAEGWDRSRTWVLSRTESGLRLKHDHRHEDGTSDAVTMYGGDTADAGTSQSQDFPIDQESIDLFQREGLTASLTNVWTVEIDPAGTDDAAFAYQLRRTVDGGAPEERFFRAEFDLTDPVIAPPPAWGHD